MAFPGTSAWKCSFYGRKLIEEAAFSRSSDRQSRSCGLLMKGPKPFHTFLGFVDGLQRFINQEYLAIAVCQGKFVNL